MLEASSRSQSKAMMATLELLSSLECIADRTFVGLGGRPCVAFC